MTREALLLKVQALSQRERQLLLLSLVVAIYMLFSLLLFSPMDAQQQRMEKEIEKIETDMLVQSGLKQTYEIGIAGDPDRVKKRQLDSLKQRLSSLDNELAELSVGLVPAERLPQLLKDVLSRSGVLILSAVETLPITEMSLVGRALDTAANNNSDAVDSVTEQDENLTASNRPVEVSGGESAGVFKHSVRVSLEGSFFPVIEYLKTLEGLPWKLFWQQMRYSVDDYPVARVDFEVYTLSTEEGLFSAQ